MILSLEPRALCYYQLSCVPSLWRSMFCGFCFLFWLLLLFVCLKILLMCMRVLPAHIHHACPGPLQARRGYKIPWNHSYRQLQVTMWVLGTAPQSSERTADALSSWANPKNCVVKTNLDCWAPTWQSWGQAIQSSARTGSTAADSRADMKLWGSS